MATWYRKLTTEAPKKIQLWYYRKRQGSGTQVKRARAVYRWDGQTWVLIYPGSGENPRQDSYWQDNATFTLSSGWLSAEEKQGYWTDNALMSFTASWVGGAPQDGY